MERKVNSNNRLTKEDIADVLNTIISGQGICKRIEIWSVRLAEELKKLENWLKKEQKNLHNKS